MKIKKLALKNFKRFTDLVIDNIPETAKLVLLIGANGSGKSSVFDAFELVNSNSKNYENEPIYYRKNKKLNYDVTLQCNDKISLHIAEHGYSGSIDQNIFYGRTSFRQVPFLTKTGFGQNKFDINTDSDRPRRYIDPDIRFENDIENVIDKVLIDVFSPDISSTEKIKQAYIVPINEAFTNIFGQGNGTKLQLTELRPPTDGNVSKITFKKGKSEIPYDYLSAGEKEVFNILLNLLSRKDLYTDTVYFFDEMDLHLNTQLQFNLLKEITENWVPENCQLWTASHSLGFIEYAKQSNEGVIVDFDDLDYDLAQVLLPVPKENLEIYDIAIPKEIITNILQNSKKVVVENKNDKYYNLALAEKGYLFLPANNNREVFLTVKSEVSLTGLRDRDYLRDDEIIKIKSVYPNLKILDYYTFENYIYHPDNINELSLPGFIKADYMEEIKRQKGEKIFNIVAEIGTSRQHYIEFKYGIENDGNLQPIIDALNSNEFNSYYPFYNMKDFFNKACLTKFKYTTPDLVKTNWFKQQIEAIVR